MKPIFCGNLDFDARQSDVERLFRKYGKIDRVDLKSGFAFIYMEDERDAEYAIRRLDQTEFGRKGRRIRVEWTKAERDNRRSGGDSKKSSTNTKPSKTLFIINFDPVHTRTRDLERHFDPYGKISNLRIRRNFAFIQFETQEEATKALEATNLSKFMDRVITVEYAIRDDDVKRDGYSPDRRGRGSPDGKYGRGSPDGRYGRGRSPSPYRRGRGSPDYGRGSNPASRPEPRGSPKYERAESPMNGRYDSRSPPPRGSNPSSRPEPRGSPKYERAESPMNGRYDSRSPPPRGSNPSSRPEPRGSPKYERDESPMNKRYDSRSPPPRDRSRS